MNSYDYAIENIKCECITCNCPSARSIKSVKSFKQNIRRRLKNIKPYSFTYIDARKKLTYFDVPKAASTTIRNSFFKDNHHYEEKSNCDYLESYFKFTFVRNPWSRMVSNWKMFTTQPRRINQLKSMTSLNLSKFEDFVYFTSEVKNHHWLPQVLYVPQKVDFIGKIETFNRDIKQIFEYVQKPYFDLSKQNKTQETDFHKYYSTKMKDFVAELYIDDIKRFNYDF